MLQGLRSFAASRSPRFWIVTALVLQPLFVALYLLCEKTVVFWDYAMYADMARDLYQSADFAEGWSKFTASLAQNYNLIFALPSMAGFALFGESRFAFILTQALLIMPLYMASLAFVLSRLFEKPFGRVYAWSFGLCALAPFIWFPLLEGYPDHGAAAFLMLALGLLLDRQKSWRHVIGAGLALAASILLRRHYAYAGLALLAAGGLYDLIRLRSRKVIGLYAAAGFTALAGLALTEPVYLEEMVRTNFTALYHSYDRGAGYFLLFALTRMGIDLVMLGIAGWYLYLKNNSAKHENFGFVLAFAFLWFVLWMTGPAQAADHYLLALCPLLAGAGLVGLALTIKNPKIRSGLVVFLVLRSVFALGLSPEGPMPSDPPSLLPTYISRPPVRDADYDQLVGLGRNLILTTNAPNDRIVIVGSSFLLNQDKLRVLLNDVLHSPETASRIIHAPEIDGPDQTPADAFASATIYVVPRNAQYHLDPSGQKGVTALWSSLIKMREESTFFERLQNKYKLGDQTIEIWRRKSWTPDKLLRGLYLIGEEVQFMRPWVATQGAGDVQIVQNLQDTQIIARPGNVQRAISLFMLVPLEAGKYKVSALARKEEVCGPLYIRARIDDMLGQTIYEKTGSTSDPTTRFEENLVLQDKKTGFLSLDLWRAQDGPCMIQLDELKVEREP